MISLATQGSIGTAPAFSLSAHAQALGSRDATVFIAIFINPLYPIFQKKFQL
jgi:hypothetical protein